MSRASAVRVLKHSYSVSSRLVGHRLRVRLHADIVELDHRGGVRMSGATIGRDDTLELRLKALRLPSIPLCALFRHRHN